MAHKLANLLEHWMEAGPINAQFAIEHQLELTMLETVGGDVFRDFLVLQDAADSVPLIAVFWLQFCH